MYYSLPYQPGCLLLLCRRNRLQQLHKARLIPVRPEFFVAADSLGKHLAFWIQPNPPAKTTIFVDRFQLAEAMFNAGSVDNNVQVRGGQALDLAGAGFSGMNCPITATAPLFILPVNGFNPWGSRGTLLQYNGPRLTTGKIWMYFNDGINTSPDPDLSFHRSGGIGLTAELLATIK